MGFAALAAGRPSLQLVVLFTAAFAWVALLLLLYMLAFSLYQRARGAYLASRRALYEPAIELVLGEEPLEKVLEAYRPKRRGDEAVILAVMVEAMRYLKGQPFDVLYECAERLGLVDACLNQLKSSSEARKGRAVEALGMMGVKRAVPTLVQMLDREPRHMRLVILRALAAIKDASALPAFARAAEDLPAAMLPRLASLMLEFGPPALPALLPMINKHAAVFPQLVLAEILRLAADEGKV